MHRKTQLAWLLTPGGKVVEGLLEPLYKPGQDSANALSPGLHYSHIK